MSRPLERAEGYVWCHVHGCIHDDDTNPYGEADENLQPVEACSPSEHRAVYFRHRVGDRPVE